jgi:hypothetical protein
MNMTTDIAGYNNGAYKDLETLLIPQIGPISVMLVNHHGSYSSTNTAWVDSLRPKAAIISMGDANDYGHPSQAVINRLCYLPTTYIYQTETNTDPLAGTIPVGRGRAMDSNIHIIVGDTSFTVAGDHYSLPVQGMAAGPISGIITLFTLSTPYPNPTKF